MIKYLLSFIGFILFFCSVNGQTIINEGFLKYTETKLWTNKIGKEVRQINKHSYHFSNQFLKMSSQIKQNVFITSISQCNNNSTYSYATNGDKYYSMKETSSPNFFELGLYNKSEPEIAYTEDTFTIKNYSCKKAIMNFTINSKKGKMEIWYSPDYKIKANCFNYFFQNLKGLPISFKFTDYPKFSIGNSTINAACEYLLDTFYVTKNYKIDSIENKEKYVAIQEEEKVNKLMELMFGNKRSFIIPKGTPITKEITTMDGGTITMTKYNPFKEGIKLENFKAVNYDGIEKSLESYKGNVVVINFWFTRCGPCIKEMPVLNKIAAANKGNNVSFLSITYSHKEEVSEFLKTTKFDFEKITDGQALIDTYGVSAYPSTIIIDKNQIIRFIKIDEFKNEKELQKEIDRLL
jgi:thiol-disulfide isomerase/thioredoxin